MNLFQIPSHQLTLKDALSELDKNLKQINDFSEDSHLKKLLHSLKQTQEAFNGILIAELAIWEYQIHEIIESKEAQPHVGLKLNSDLLNSSIHYLKERARHNHYIFLQLELEILSNQIQSCYDLVSKIVKLFRFKIISKEIHDLHSHLLHLLKDQMNHFLNLCIREQGLFDIYTIIQGKSGLFRFALDSFIHSNDDKNRKRRLKNLEFLANDFIQSCLCLDHHHTTVKEYIIDIHYCKMFLNTKDCLIDML